MAVHNALDCGQTYAGAWKIGGRMQTLEHPEELVSKVHIETGTVISDEESRLWLVRIAEFDMRFWRFGGEFPGIAQKIIQDQTKQRLITVDPKVRGNGPL